MNTINIVDKPSKSRFPCDFVVLLCMNNENVGRCMNLMGFVWAPHQGAFM